MQHLMWRRTGQLLVFNIQSMFYILFSIYGVSHRFRFSLRRLILVMWPPSVDHWTTFATGQVSMLRSSRKFNRRWKIAVMQIAFKAWKPELDYWMIQQCHLVVKFLMSPFAIPNSNDLAISNDFFMLIYKRWNFLL